MGPGEGIVQAQEPWGEGGLSIPPNHLLRREGEGRTEAAAQHTAHPESTTRPSQTLHPAGAEAAKCVCAVCRVP